MAIARRILHVKTPGRGFSNITREVSAFVTDCKIDTGVCHLFIQHTSASLLIQENADPAVLGDLENFLADLAPESRAWVHDDEGPDDMPAHAKTALTHTSESIPVGDGRLLLGTWQGIYVVEHRERGHERRVVVTIMGE